MEIIKCTTDNEASASLAVNIHTMYEIYVWQQSLKMGDSEEMGRDTFTTKKNNNKSDLRPMNFGYLHGKYLLYICLFKSRHKD